LTSNQLINLAYYCGGYFRPAVSALRERALPLPLRFRRLCFRHDKHCEISSEETSSSHKDEYGVDMKILHVIPANLCFVSAFGNRCTGSEQEERDTYLLLHALDATQAGQQAFVSAV